MLDPKRITPLPPQPLPTTGPPVTIPVPEDRSVLKVEETPPKSPLHSKWWWGMLIMALGGILTMIGVDPALLGFLEDGIQIEDAIAFLGLLSAVVGYLIKDYGHRQATRPLSGPFPGIRTKG